MEIKTKFAIGDKAIVLKNSKAVEIEINTIIVNEAGIRYAEEVGDFIISTYPESQCFVTKDELIQYITSE